MFVLVIIVFLVIWMIYYYKKVKKEKNKIVQWLLFLKYFSKFLIMEMLIYNLEFDRFCGYWELLGLVNNIVRDSVWMLV